MAQTLKRGTSLIILISFSFFLFYSFRDSERTISDSKWSEEKRGIIVHIYDGDTFKVRFNRSEERLRLLGVDAPEIGDPSEEVDLWARLARRFSLYYLLKKQVTLTFERERTDRYGRLLAYLWLENGFLFNELIIKQGLARCFEAASVSPTMKKRLKQAEEEAKKAKRGIWQSEWPKAIEPDKVRHYLGHLKAVNFVCERVRVERGYTLIYARQGHFRIYISRDRRPFFSQLEKIKPDDFISVYGLIEDYRGQTQMILFYPQQLRIISKT